MYAIGTLRRPVDRARMEHRTNAPRRRGRPQAASVKQYPNRIHELTRAHGLTYARVADATNSHEVTIANLANGKATLTFPWMQRLAKVFDVTPAEIVQKPLTEGLRRVRVTGAVEAGAWHESSLWPEDRQYDVLVPDDLTLRDRDLYAAEVRGESMNARYQNGSVVVFSKITGSAYGEIVDGRRYHIRLTRPDGTVEDTVKTLVRDAKGAYWLKPESDDPRFQEWLPLDGPPGCTVELLGRARFAVQREE